MDSSRTRIRAGGPESLRIGRMAPTRTCPPMPVRPARSRRQLVGQTEFVACVRGERVFRHQLAGHQPGEVGWLEPPLHVNGNELLCFGFRLRRQFVRSRSRSARSVSACELTETSFTRGHGQGTSARPATPASEDFVTLGLADATPTPGWPLKRTALAPTESGDCARKRSGESGVLRFGHGVLGR